MIWFKTWICTGGDRTMAFQLISLKHTSTSAVTSTYNLKKLLHQIKKITMASTTLFSLYKNRIHTISLQIVCENMPTA